MSQTDSLDQLHRDMEAHNLAPTWKYVGDMVTVEPAVSYGPFLWKWDTVIEHVMRAGDLITPDRGAERRSMEHVNPALKAQYGTTHTIGTAFQLVRPGEFAPSHRHQAAAIRFAISSRGGTVFSRVQGEPLPMEQFDLLLTPAGTWHEHENRTDHDIIWMDALDYPLVNLLQCSWFQSGAGTTVAKAERERTAQFAKAVRPLGWNENIPPGAMRWPWVETRATLDALGQDAASPYDGAIVEYVNPLNNGPTLPTLSCRVQRMLAHMHGQCRRIAGSKVYFVMEGSGYSIIAGTRFDWSKGDVFMVPTWAWHEHHNGPGESYLFSVTDEPVMRSLGMYRSEERTDPQEVTSLFSPTRTLTPPLEF